MKYIAKVEFLDALDHDKKYRVGDEFTCPDSDRIDAMVALGILDKVGEKENVRRENNTR